MNRPGGRQ